MDKEALKLEIEKRILEFIRKSPIGVTSSEISRFLGINRITLTKYLAIFKEKSLIDFKQLGMAKLWFIPVKINKVIFLNMLLSNILKNLDKNISKSVIDKSSKEIAEYIENEYKQFYNTKKMSVEQVCEAIIDFEKKIGADFKIEKKDKKIILINYKCPFSSDPNLCLITTNIIDIIASKNLEGCKVKLEGSIAEGKSECKISLRY